MTNKDTEHLIQDLIFLNQPKKKEHILTFRSDYINEILTKNGIDKNITNILFKGVDIENHFPRESVFFGCREYLELVPFFRHPIFYITIEHKGNFAVYKRLSCGGESKLHNQHSIGFGGHVDLEDAISENSVLDIKKTIELSAQREIAEELFFPFNINNFKIDTKAYIIDNRDSVGRVHIGIWQNLIIPDQYDVSDVDISNDESDKMMFLGFKPKKWFYENIEEISFEGWSEMIIRNNF